MAQAGYTPIQLYHSTTPAAVPTAGNLLAGELAINNADGILYYEDSSGVVKPLAHNITPVANGGTGVTTSTGTGSVVLSNSPTLVTPALGTPASGTLTNCTGLPTAGIVDNAVTDAKLRDSAGLSVIGRTANSTGDPADIVAGTNKQVLRREGSDLAFGAIDLSSNQAVTGTLPVNQGGTGITSFGSGVATWLGTPSSANLAAAVSDETGTGSLVFSNSPTLVTPTLGTPSSGNLTNTTVDGTNAVGFRTLPQVSQSAAYTLVLTDSGKHILHPSADTTARIFTIPANSSVPFPIGAAVTFVNQNGAGVITIAITTDTMRLAGAGTTGSRTLAANGVATAIKLTATEWIISGVGLT